MVGSKITLLDPLARVTVRDERIVVRTVGVQGPPGPPTITPGAVVTAEGDLIVGGPGGTPQALAAPIGMARSIQFAYDQAAGAPAWREAPYADLNDFPRIGGETDDVGCFTRALAASDYVLVTPKIGGGDWTIPLIDADVVNDPPDTWVNVTSGKTIRGTGRHAPIILTGGNTAGNAPAFVVRGDERGVVFEDLFFVGENGSWDDLGSFAVVGANNSTAILVSGDAEAEYPSDVVIRRCEAEFMWGFAFHDYTTLSKRTAVLDCAVRYASNSINVCSEQSLQIGNRLDHCEGMEVTGRGAIIGFNSLELVHGSGLTYGGASIDQPGGLVGFNTIDGCTGPAYNIGDGVRKLVMVGNTAFDVASGQYSLRYGESFGDEWMPYDVQIIANNLENQVFASAPQTTYVGNHFHHDGSKIDIRAADQAFDANRFTGTGRPIEPGVGVSGSTAIRLWFGASNQYDPFEFYDGSAGVARFVEGSHLRLIYRPAAHAMFRGVTVAVQGGTGVADTLDRGEKNAADANVWRPVTQQASSHGTASVADGGTIAHGLGVTPTFVSLTPKVGGRVAAVAGLTSTLITIDLEDSAGNDIAVAEDVMWRAEV